MDEVKKLCTSLRRNAKEERVLFHYNGHGVPRPTVNGEIWVFNKVRLWAAALKPAESSWWLCKALQCSGRERLDFRGFTVFTGIGSCADSCLFSPCSWSSQRPNGLSLPCSRAGELFLQVPQGSLQNPEEPAAFTPPLLSDIARRCCHAWSKQGGCTMDLALLPYITHY